MLVWVALRGFAAADASATLALASYLFIPYPRPSGIVEPLYGLGWTLNYEMMFYVIFACALLARRNAAVAAVSLFLLMLVAIHALVPALPPQLAFSTNPIILEFVFGMALALMFRAGVRLPRAVCCALIALAIPPLFLATSWPGAPSRWLVWGVPAAMIVAAVAFARKPAYVPKLAVALGDASYALYLTHPLAMVLAREAAERSLFINPATAPWLYFAGTVALSILLAFAVYYAFERPTTRFLRRRFEASRLGPVESGLTLARSPDGA